MEMNVNIDGVTYKLDWDYSYNYEHNVNLIILLFQELIENNIYFSLESSSEAVAVFKIKLKSKQNVDNKFEFLIGNEELIILNTINKHNQNRILLDNSDKIKNLFNNYILINEVETNEFNKQESIEIIKLFKLIYKENYSFEDVENNYNNYLFSIYKRDPSKKYLNKKLIIKKHSLYDENHKYSISNDNIYFYSLFEILEKYNSLDRILRLSLSKSNGRFVDLPF